MKCIHSHAFYFVLSWIRFGLQDSTLADMAAKVYAYAQYERLGLKKSFMIGILLSLVGCLMILMSEGYES